MAKPEPTPEGRLLKAALRDSGLSGRKAAEQAGLSDGRFRQIINGYISMGGGQYATVSAPAETLARIATVLGVSPTQLRSAGRGDAAEVLERQLGARVRMDEDSMTAFAHEADLAAWLRNPDDVDESDAMRIFNNDALLQALADRLNELSRLRSPGMLVELAVSLVPRDMSSPYGVEWLESVIAGYQEELAEIKAGLQEGGQSGWVAPGSSEGNVTTPTRMADYKRQRLDDQALPPSQAADDEQYDEDGLD